MVRSCKGSRRQAESRTAISKEGVAQKQVKSSVASLPVTQATQKSHKVYCAIDGRPNDRDRGDLASLQKEGAGEATA